MKIKTLEYIEDKDLRDFFISKGKRELFDRWWDTSEVRNDSYVYIPGDDYEDWPVFEGCQEFWNMIKEELSIEKDGIMVHCWW